MPRSEGGALDRGRPVPPASPFPLPLTHGDLTAAEAAELHELKELIQDAVQFRCDAYKEKCLRRRIAVRMRARGVHSYAAYGSLLRTDTAEYDCLLDTLTINVSKFFRNPDVWQAVADRVLPELFALPAESIDVWSAGAASGEEAYTMGMLTQDHAVRLGHDADRVRILGTDIDRGSLACAARGEYTDFAMTDIDPAVRDRWFDYNGTYHLRPAARRGVRFETLDLMNDEYPAGQHLIFCRNVVIYFQRSVQEDLFRRLHAALEPGGFLVLGKVEALFGLAAGLFETVANRERIFRKP
jgi:chemotaxis protein methyltransferase CheR